jgi:hypothetical protein
VGESERSDRPKITCLCPSHVFITPLSLLREELLQVLVDKRLAHAPIAILAHKADLPVLLLLLPLLSDLNPPLPHSVSQTALTDKQLMSAMDISETLQAQ